MRKILITILSALFFTNLHSQNEEEITAITRIGEITVPQGFIRKNAEKGSFAEFARNLKLKTSDNYVFLFNGKLKGNQQAQYRVLTTDVGTSDLQQCADAVMRLQAEYWFSQKLFNYIHFNFTSGERIDFLRYASGERVKIRSNKAVWEKTAKPDTSYQTFRKYMTLIFSYAGTFSLSQELQAVRNIEEIEIGDVFIFGGFPGHAVTVIDVAQNTTSGERIFMLCQSYMPAQEIHVLKNPTDTELSPWYSVKFDNKLETPEWTFEKNSLKRFVRP